MLAAMTSDETLRLVLASTRSIAVVGAKDVPGQPVDRVGRYLIAQGFEVLPVHPRRRVVWDLPVAASLAELPHPVDLVVLFRAPQYCPGHAREVLAMPVRPMCVWMQEGITSPEARRLLEAAGVKVVEDRCVMVDHARLFGTRGH